MPEKGTTEKGKIDEIFRRIHTFKGIFKSVHSDRIFINVLRYFFSPATGGAKMKKTLTFSALFCAYFLFFLAPSVLSEDYKQIHETYLDQKINCCQKKAEMLRNSKYENIRKCAEINAQKAAYYLHAKKRILEDLNVRGCCLKPHQIDVYLIERFKGISEGRTMNVNK